MATSRKDERKIKRRGRRRLYPEEKKKGRRDAKMIAGRATNSKRVTLLVPRNQVGAANVAGAEAGMIDNSCCNCLVNVWWHTAAIFYRIRFKHRSKVTRDLVRCNVRFSRAQVGFHVSDRGGQYSFQKAKEYASSARFMEDC